MRTSIRPRRLVVFPLAASLLLGPGAVGLSAGDGAGAMRTHFQATDDWLFDPLTPLEPLLEAIECLGGEATGNPLQPCTPGARIHIRELPAVSLVLASDPRFSGTLVVTSNANFDPSYAGPVWGRWTLTRPGGGGSWQGIWEGKRRFFPAPSGAGPGSWVADLRMVGHGAGSLEGLQAKATYAGYSFSPVPVPYELLALLGFPICPGGSCAPEGAIAGQILDTAAD